VTSSYPHIVSRSSNTAKWALRTAQKPPKLYLCGPLMTKASSVTAKGRLPGGSHTATRRLGKPYSLTIPTTSLSAAPCDLGKLFAYNPFKSSLTSRQREWSSLLQREPCQRHSSHPRRLRCFGTSRGYQR